MGSVPALDTTYPVCFFSTLHTDGSFLILSELKTPDITSNKSITVLVLIMFLLRYLIHHDERLPVWKIVSSFDASESAM